MSFPIEIEAAALAQTLRRVEPTITADEVDSLSILNRLLAASIAGVENATDSHWALVAKMIRASAESEEAMCP